MIENFAKINDFLNDSNVKFIKKEFQKIVQDYIFLHIADISNLKENVKSTFYEKIKKSEVILIDMIEGGHNQKLERYLIIGLEKMLIIHELSSLSIHFVHNLLSINLNMNVCFLPNVKQLFDESIEIIKVLIK